MKKETLHMNKANTKLIAGIAATVLLPFTSVGPTLMIMAMGDYIDEDDKETQLEQLHIVTNEEISKETNEEIEHQKKVEDYLNENFRKEEGS